MVCRFGVPILRVNIVSKEKMLIQNFNVHIDKTSKSVTLTIVALSIVQPEMLRYIR